MDPKELYRKAVEAMPKAYAPFSNFTVGAALLTGDGRVITGVNVEKLLPGGQPSAPNVPPL
jgi:cytidine deaminase (EC 3.5.4.5)